MFLVGRNADALGRLPTKVFGATLHSLGAGLATVLPNLQIYVPARPLLTGEALEANLPVYLGWATVQALGWVLGLLVVAAAVFHRRDFL